MGPVMEGQLALTSSYEPGEWMVERVPADKTLAGSLGRFKTMAACGWDLTCLLSPDLKTVVAFGCR